MRVISSTGVFGCPKSPPPPPSPGVPGEGVRSRRYQKPFLAAVHSFWRHCSFCYASALECSSRAEVPAPPQPAPSVARSGDVPEPKQPGGEPDGIVQVANLVYAGTKSSNCFSDHFLIDAEKLSSISTSRRFHAVKLGSEELFEFPLVIMTGEGGFDLPDVERQNLRKFVEQGGLLLASAGCSSPDWDKSFRAEMAQVFPDHPLKALAMDHPLFHTVYDVTELNGLHQTPRPLEGDHQSATASA